MAVYAGWILRGERRVLLFVYQIIGLLLDERMEQFTDPPCHARIIFGFGLTCMRERVEQLHGTMKIMSRPETGHDHCDSNSPTSWGHRESACKLEGPTKQWRIASWYRFAAEMGGE